MAVQNLTTKARPRRTSRSDQSGRRRRSAKRRRQHSKSAESGKNSPTPEIRQRLEDLRRSLGLIMSVVIVAVEALKSQNADNDSEVAHVLRTYAGNKLCVEIEGIQTLLRRLGAASPRRA